MAEVNSQGSQSRFIADVLEEHFMELSSALEKRANMLCQPEFYVSDVGDIDDRIEAHIDGMLQSKVGTMPLLASGLAAGGGDCVAAATVLLRMGDETATEMLMSALVGECPQVRNAVCEAICWAQASELPLVLALDGAEPSVAASLMLALTTGGGQAERRRLELLLNAESAQVRAMAWKVVALSPLERE